MISLIFHPNVLSYLMIFQNSSIHRRISLSFFTVEEMGRPGILMYINYNRSQKPASLVWATRATDSSLIVNEISESRKRERERMIEKSLYSIYTTPSIYYICVAEMIMDDAMHWTKAQIFSRLFDERENEDVNPAGPGKFNHYYYYYYYIDSLCFIYV